MMLVWFITIPMQDKIMLQTIRLIGAQRFTIYGPVINKPIFVVSIVPVALVVVQVALPVLIAHFVINVDSLLIAIL
jgi:hypothetical protein